MYLQGKISQFAIDIKTSVIVESEDGPQKLQRDLNHARQMGRVMAKYDL